MTKFTRKEYIGDIILDGQVSTAGTGMNVVNVGNVFVPNMKRSLDQSDVRVTPFALPTNVVNAKSVGAFTTLSTIRGINPDTKAVLGEESYFLRSLKNSNYYPQTRVAFHEESGTNTSAVDRKHVDDWKITTSLPSSALTVDQGLTGQIPINPGHSLLFPWLSEIANFYEEYSIDSLTIEYMPTIGNTNSETAIIGSVLLGYQSNAADAAFKTKAEMLEHSNTITAKSNTGFVYKVPLSKPFKTYFVSQATSVPEVQNACKQSSKFIDVKTLFPGLLTFATQGFSGGISGQALGQIFVSYDITLKKPFIRPPLANGVISN